jgi:D-3-phosphoglycerate dehydrogenase
VNGIVIHTGVSPQDPYPEVTEVLNVPGVTFVKRGPCRTPEQVLAAVRDADVAICVHEPYTRTVLAQALRLKAVVRVGVGVDTVDLEAATDNGVLVTYFPDFCTREVANHAIVLLLACAKKVLRLDRALRAEGWEAARALRSPMGPIHGETLGLVAFGHIAPARAVHGDASDRP